MQHPILEKSEEQMAGNQQRNGLLFILWQNQEEVKKIIVGMASLSVTNVWALLAKEIIQEMAEDVLADLAENPTKELLDILNNYVVWGRPCQTCLGGSCLQSLYYQFHRKSWTMMWICKIKYFHDWTNCSKTFLAQDFGSAWMFHLWDCGCNIIDRVQWL